MKDQEYHAAKRLILDSHRRFLELDPEGVLLDFRGETLRLAIFDGADLSRATFNEARFHKANFTSCSFHLAAFENARMTRVKLTGTILRPTKKLDGPTS